ncbi:hypothetical protein [Kribbella solani]|uniref:Uncharacterized protein n=1 Tax=Kribbella solani TaxID=236067 RepID=A0A841E4W2_9ACTN|nr:hypothetical protein [Kribbella solani]MBB5982378.1 hypothetical protein [Kribbella solani]
MARRGAFGTLMGSGLVVITVLGGIGGYALGLLTTDAPSAAYAGVAAPLGTDPSSPDPSATPSQSQPPRKVTYDKSPALRADELNYKTRTFTVRDIFKSRMSLRVPSDWSFTQPDPPKTGRFTDPTGKRWIRVESGFTVSRPPEESLKARIAQLSMLPPNQMVQLLSQSVHDNYATLMYTYVPDENQSPEGVVRYVVVRWVADASGNCAVEMSSTGLPQDKDALVEVLDRATDSVQRHDSPVGS